MQAPQRICFPLARNRALLGGYKLPLRHTQVDTERQFETFITQAPALLCVLASPTFVFDLVNLLYQQLFTGRQLLSLPLHQVLPATAKAATAGIMAQVCRTEQSFATTEIVRVRVREWAL